MSFLGPEKEGIFYRSDINSQKFGITHLFTYYHRIFNDRFKKYCLYNLNENQYFQVFCQHVRKSLMIKVIY
jgi:uncharacterized protein VirK/YbjX